MDSNINNPSPNNNPLSPDKRLNKYLALQLGVSRREADELIAAGKVYVGDSVAQLGQRIIDDAVITVSGKPVARATEAYVYLALNKPIGYVSSRRQQGDSPTIYSLLPEKYHALKPVGRLDRDSSGLLLLTNDGDFAHSMTHPKFYKTKRYEVELSRPLEPLHQQMISDFGVTLPDGPSKFSVTTLDGGRYEIVMHEGRNRQIRRTFDALGYFVTALHRTDFGSYTLAGLKFGQHKEISI